jgi:hypothetical protein
MGKMKIRVSFKTPDAVSDALDDYFPHNEDGEYETEDSYQAREDAMSKLKQWVQYGECITIEFDLDANTANVVKVK